MPALLAPLLVAALLLLPASANAAQTPDQILSDLAQNQTHSWVDSSLGYDALEAKYKAGGRLYVACGFVSEVARRLLVEAGYHARVVGSVTLEPYDEMNDGHAMVEVWQNQRWELYDIDSNEKAIDSAGQGLGIVDQVAATQAGTAHWREIATDPLWNAEEPNPTLRALAESGFADLVATHKRLLGVALLPADPSGVAGYMLFHDASQAQRLADYVGPVYRLASDAEWRGLAALPKPSAAPAQPALPVTQPAAPLDPPAAVVVAPAEPAPAQPAAVATAPAARPTAHRSHRVHRRPSCRRLIGRKHRHHRRASCRRVRRLVG